MCALFFLLAARYAGHLLFYASYSYEDFSDNIDNNIIASVVILFKIPLVKFDYKISKK